MIIRLLNTGLTSSVTARRRLWVVPGQRVHLVSGVSFCLMVTREGTVIEFRDPSETIRHSLAVVLRNDVGLVFIPRAVELGALNWPMRHLMEIALTKSAAQLPGLSVSPNSER